MYFLTEHVGTFNEKPKPDKNALLFPPVKGFGDESLMFWPLWFYFSKQDKTPKIKSFERKPGCESGQFWS